MFFKIGVLKNFGSFHTAVYDTFWKPKLRGQFSENLVLWIYEFIFNSSNRISKEEKNMKVLRIIHLKYDKNFNLLIVY